MELTFEVLDPKQPASLTLTGPDRVRVETDDPGNLRLLIRDAEGREIGMLHLRETHGWERETFLVGAVGGWRADGTWIPEDEPEDGPWHALINEAEEV